MKVETM